MGYKRKAQQGKRKSIRQERRRRAACRTRLLGTSRTARPSEDPLEQSHEDSYEAE